MKLPLNRKTTAIGASLSIVGVAFTPAVSGAIAQETTSATPDATVSSSPRSSAPETSQTAVPSVQSSVEPTEPASSTPSVTPTEFASADPVSATPSQQSDLMPSASPTETPSPQAIVDPRLTLTGNDFSGNQRVTFNITGLTPGSKITSYIVTPDGKPHSYGSYGRADSNGNFTGSSTVISYYGNQPGIYTMRFKDNASGLWTNVASFWGATPTVNPPISAAIGTPINTNLTNFTPNGTPDTAIGPLHGTYTISAVRSCDTKTKNFSGNLDVQGNSPGVVQFDEGDDGQWTLTYTDVVTGTVLTSEMSVGTGVCPAPTPTPTPEPPTPTPEPPTPTPEPPTPTPTPNPPTPTPEPPTPIPEPPTPPVPTPTESPAPGPIPPEPNPNPTQDPIPTPEPVPATPEPLPNPSEEKDPSPLPEITSPAVIQPAVDNGGNTDENNAGVTYDPTTGTYEISFVGFMPDSDVEILLRDLQGHVVADFIVHSDAFGVVYAKFYNLQDGSYTVEAKGVNREGARVTYVKRFTADSKNYSPAVATTSGSNKTTGTSNIPNALAYSGTSTQKTGLVLGLAGLTAVVGGTTIMIARRKKT